jgi:integrase
MKVFFWVHSQRTNKEGKSNLILRLTLEKEVMNISTPIFLFSQTWDPKTQRISPYHLNSTEVNQKIEDYTAFVLGKYHELLDRDPRIALLRIKSQVKLFWEGRSRLKGFNLIELLDVQIADIQKLIGKSYTISTLKKYQGTRKILLEFVSSQYYNNDIDLQDIDLVFVKQFEQYLRLKRGNETNSVIKRLQHVKKIITLGIQLGYNIKNPFEYYKLKFKPSDRGYLTEDEVKRILNYEPTSEAMAHTRDISLFMIFTGIPYIEIFHLNKSNITVDVNKKTWVVMKRIKTGIQMQIPLLPIPLDILERYTNLSKTNKIFPMPSNQVFNKNIKRMTAIVGIKKSISSHFYRHTFGSTITLANGIGIEVISKLMGHSSIKVTGVYARILPKALSDAMEGIQNRF